jgi:hypothetical protein
MGAHFHKDGRAAEYRGWRRRPPTFRWCEMYFRV